MSESKQYVFLDSHRPQLKAGTYQLVAEVAVSVDGLHRHSTSAEFVIGGERYSLVPAAVHSVFPPEGSSGGFSDCHPHIALARDTQPWERSADGQGAPWLALIVLHPEEAAQYRLQHLTLKEYRQRCGTVAQHEADQSDSDALQVLNLPPDLLSEALPINVAELNALCHVRGHKVERMPGGPFLEDSVSVVVSKRLPMVGRNTLHLVSLEDRFSNGKLDPSIPFVSLKSWSFSCSAVSDPGQGSLATLFAGLAAESERNGAWLRVPNVDGVEAAEPYLACGRTPLPHLFRTGEEGASWYAGPLMSASDRAPIKLPAASADALLMFDESIGMLDVTYAAAWELGRLLAIEQPVVKSALSAWRRQQVLVAHGIGRSGDDHLREVFRPRESMLVTPELGAWVSDVRRLKGIPFKYLVPDERMLPTESVRFFTVNLLWIDVLLDGAFSLARLPQAERGKPERSRAEETLLSRPRGSAESVEMTGFLVRSAIVSGWPDLVVEANGLEVALPAVRISPSINLYLFDGNIRSVVIRQHANTVHFVQGAAPGLDLNMSGAALAQHMLDKTQALSLQLA